MFLIPSLHNKIFISADFEQKKFAENWQNVSKNGQNFFAQNRPKSIFRGQFFEKTVNKGISYSFKFFTYTHWLDVYFSPGSYYSVGVWYFQYFHQFKERFAFLPLRFFAITSFTKGEAKTFGNFGGKVQFNMVKKI